MIVFRVSCEVECLAILACFWAMGFSVVFNMTVCDGFVIFPWFMVVPALVFCSFWFCRFRSYVYDRISTMMFHGSITNIGYVLICFDNLDIIQRLQRHIYGPR